MKFIYILSKKLNSFPWVGPAILNTIVNSNCIFLLPFDFIFLFLYNVAPEEDSFYG